MMTHEGEAQIRYPDGETAMIPASQLNQDALKRIEKSSGMLGAQRGGVFQPAERNPNPAPVIPQPEGQNFSTPTQPTTPTGGTLPSGLGLNTIPTPPAPVGGKTLPSGLGIGTIPTTPTEPSGTLPSGFGLQTIGGVVQPRKPDDKIPDVVKPQEIVSPNLGGTTDIKPPVVEDIQKPTDTTSASYQQALNRLQKYAEGEDPFAKKIREEERMRLAGEEVAAKGALEQRMSQLGLTGREALTEQAMLQREYGAQEVELMGALRKGEADRAFAAAQQIPGEVLAGMKHELGKEQWQKVFDAEKESKDYNRKMDLAAALIAQGGEENFAQASEIFQNMFGTSVDFSNALTQENYGKFNQGMERMSQLLASGSSWEDAFAAMEADGSFALMNMTEADAQKMYDNMKLNSDPLYKSMTMVDDWVKNGLIDQDKADELKAFIEWSFTNTEGTKIEDGYSVFDENGNEVGFFKTEAEKDKWIADNPGKYTDKFVKNHVTATNITPEGVPAGEPTTPTPVIDPETTNKVKTLLGRDPTPEELAMFDELSDDYEYANAILNSDYSDFSGGDVTSFKKVYDKLPQDWKDKNSFGDIA
ncbi:MAG TPA: hypothetical protein VMZ04_04455, partial [Anaerolineae bacterium]|nr:hypothetical protein [Anaerolineae bacterium]